MMELLMPVVALLLATLVSALVIPLMARIAPRIGMLDMPDARKVHATPIPRVGGVGIAVGALVAILPLARLQPSLLAFIAGAAVLVVFGAWDDLRELGHYPKFAGQLVAASLVIWGGDVWIQSVPFLDLALPAWFGKPMTLFVLVGVINAVNHSDGLDGLAAGEVLLSLGAMSCLAYMFGTRDFLIMAAAVAGSLLGFLRYNTHPARVFMGDLGSQFLGFSVGVMAIVLTQQASAVPSRSIALLLIGLPVIDIVVVLALRIRGDMNWFRATRNHVHHRLLQLDFKHQDAVMILYGVQTLLVAGGVLLAFESDALALAFYAAVCGSLFGVLIWAEAAGIKARGLRVRASPAPGAERRGRPARWASAYVRFSVPLFLLTMALTAGRAGIPTSVGFLALVPIGLLLARPMYSGRHAKTLGRIAMFGSVGVLVSCNRTQAAGALPASVATMFFFALLVAALLAAALDRHGEFRGTTMDLLVVIVLISGFQFARQVLGQEGLWVTVVQTAVLLYGCEMILVLESNWSSRLLLSGAVGALAIVALKHVAYAFG